MTADRPALSGAPLANWNGGNLQSSPPTPFGFPLLCGSATVRSPALLSIQVTESEAELLTSQALLGLRLKPEASGVHFHSGVLCGKPKTTG